MKKAEINEKTECTQGMMTHEGLGGTRTTTVRGFSEGVNFDLSGISLDEEFVQAFELGGSGFSLGTGETELVGKSQSFRALRALHDINGLLENGFRVLLGNIFNVDTTLLGRNHDGAVGSTIHQDSEVSFARNVNAFSDEDLLDGDTVGASLVSAELVSNHLFGEALDIRRAAKQ